ncbi:hypothetical protein L227DRAFT_574318 [Lentinus tigrinus ALCF2SS1-6]|uniref:Transmembrane protein n=1 Tax=Lentinus tigrinus ALCF2SS1-6 TaxID=1328759 RepID=A0A5C2SIJ1_9APHY|nr:hypothetical protein L227DRAFT_574318 [Lentinus tigrinus ALCF2SS1-6]
MNIFTSEDLYDSSDDYAKLHYVERTVERLMEEISQYPSLCLDDVEIGIKLMDYKDEDGEAILGCHYLANTKSREVFYLDEMNDEHFFPHFGNTILSREHLHMIAESAYWQHVFMFPHGRRLFPEDCQELQADLLWWFIDKVTSDASPFPHTPEENHRFHAIIKDIALDVRGHEVLPQYIVGFARLKHNISKARFVRYHGEYCVQMDAYKSQSGEWPEPAKGFKIVGWLFFFTPQIYLERLRRVWVDYRVNTVHWRKLVTELQEDWTASITPATVILTTNIGFLAIQSVDQGGVALPDRTVAQVLSYMSTVLSIGNIIACTILARQHRGSLACIYGTEPIAYFRARASSHWGLERLAIVYAIPMAFFFWALLTLFLAVGWVCFYHTSPVTRCTVAITVLISFLLLAAVVHNGDWTQSQAKAAFRARMDRTKELVKNARRMPRRFGTTVRRLSTDAAAVFKKMKTLSEPRPAESAEDRPTATRRTSLSGMFARSRRTRWSSSWRSSDDTILPM